VRIFKDLHLGSTRTFNLIDKLKCKVFGIPIDPAIGNFTLLNEKSPLIQIWDEKRSMIMEGLKSADKQVVSPTKRVTPEYILTSGRRALHEFSLRLPDRPITSDGAGIRVEDQ
jgi:hypothetical protein